MIYLDTSVALAHIFQERRRPTATFWDAPLCSSRLLEYELWNRLHARRRPPSEVAAASILLNGILIIDLVPEVLARALEPFAAPVRTLDAMHLATMFFLREQGRDVRLASYDERFLTAARTMGFDAAAL